MSMQREALIMDREGHVDSAPLSFALRARSSRPTLVMLALTLIVVAGGISFARVTHGHGVPWWIFYAVPALITLAVPPLVLRMSTRELLVYLPLAVLMAPVIHVCFSLFGWHEYMPLFYVAFWSGP
jgi:hypothetical protein